MTHARSLTTSYVTVTPTPMLTMSLVVGTRLSDQVEAADQFPLVAAVIVGCRPSWDLVVRRLDVRIAAGSFTWNVVVQSVSAPSLSLTAL